MKEDRIWQLLARKLAGEATAEELKELEDVLRAHPELHFTIEAFYKIWNAVPAEQTDETDATKLLERIRKPGDQPAFHRDEKRRRHRLLKNNFMFRNYF